MNKKQGFAGTALLIIIALGVAAGLGYFAGGNKPVNTNQEQKVDGMKQELYDENRGTVIDTTVDWQALLPEITALLKSKTAQDYYKDPNFDTPVSISTRTDITGDYIDEALIGMSWGGGAASWQVVLMRVENGKPIVAKLKEKDGKISEAFVLEAGSAQYAMKTHLAQPHKALVVENFGQLPDFSESKMVYANGNYATCGLKVYAWNPDTKIFEWSESLKTQLEGKIYCRKDGAPVMGI